MKTVGSLALDEAAYKQFIFECSGSNSAMLNRMKSYVPKVVNQNLTDKQKSYIIEYFFFGLNVREIAEKFGVNKATVSRTIRRGMKRCYSGLVDFEPKMKKYEMKSGYISNKGRL